MKHTLLLTVFTVLSVVTYATAQKQPTMQIGKVNGSVKKQINQALMSYYGMKDAFVESNPRKISTKTEGFRKALDQIGLAEMTDTQAFYFQQEKNSLIKHLELLEKETNIKQKREHFNEISLTFYRVVKSFGANQYEAHLQYCWMAREGDVKDGYWISSEKKIVNPYLPEMMLHCGKVADSF